jgi:hypothetical protein
MTDYITLFKPSDFERLTIKVMEHPTPQDHPFFAKHECFQADIKGVDMNMLIKYICLNYDPRSPLLDKFNDHIERKKCAASLAGWKVDKNLKWQKNVEKILYCDDEQGNICILEYLRSLNNDSWATICTTREALYRIHQDLISEATTTNEKGSTRTSVDVAKVRTDLARQTEEMTDRLNKRMLDFLGQDESPYLRSALFDMVDKTRKFLPISPERQVFGS